MPKKYTVSAEVEIKKIGEGLEQVEREMKGLARTFDQQGGRIRQEARQINTSFKTLGTSIKTMAVSMIGVAGAGGIVFSLKRLLEGTIEAADQIGKLSDRLGISTEALSEYRYVADRSGVSFQTLTMALQRMTRRVAEAAQGTGEAKGAIAELGLSAERLNQLAPDQQFEALAGAMERVTNQADRVRLAMKLFDSEGVAVIQMMKEGASGIEELRQRFRDFGGTMTEEMVNTAVEAKDAVTDLKWALTALGQEASMIAAPGIKDVSNDLTGLVKIIRENRDVIREVLGIGAKVIRGPGGIYSAVRQLIESYRLGEEEQPGGRVVKPMPPVPTLPEVVVTAKKVDPKAQQKKIEAEFRAIQEKISAAREEEWKRTREEITEFASDFVSAIHGEPRGVLASPFWEELTKGVKNMVDEMRPQVEEIKTIWDDMVHNLSFSLEAGLFDLFKDGISNMRDLFEQFVDFLQQSFARALAKMVTDWLLFENVGGKKELGGLLGGAITALGGFFGATKSLQHGGWITEPVWGMGASGRPYAFHPPELVTPAGQVGGGVTINVVNRTGADIAARKAQPQFNGRDMIVEVVLDALHGDERMIYGVAEAARSR